MVSTSGIKYLIYLSLQGLPSFTEMGNLVSLGLFTLFSSHPSHCFLNTPTPSQLTLLKNMECGADKQQYIFLTLCKCVLLMVFTQRPN